MKKETRDVIVTAGIVLAVFGAAYVCVAVYAGSAFPFYTVESGSMMHSSNSKIGVLDTGDMVVIRQPSKVNIVSYVEGHESGYSKFGGYGDVILYERPGGTAVIHRAILYLEYVETIGTDKWWRARGLNEYTGIWTVDSVRADGAFSGKLTMSGIGPVGNRSFTLDLNVLAPVSGYVTMGDNNSEPDQINGISYNALVGGGRVLGVAGFEIPWVGVIKLYITGNNTDKIPTNSVILLILTLIAIVAVIFAVNIAYERFVRKKGPE